MIISILGGIIAALMVQILLENSKTAAIWLLRYSVLLLPEYERNDRYEQWYADLLEIEGKASTLCQSIGLSLLCFRVYMSTTIADRSISLLVKGGVKVIAVEFRIRKRLGVSNNIGGRICNLINFIIYVAKKLDRFEEDEKEKMF